MRPRPQPRDCGLESNQVILGAIAGIQGQTLKTAIASRPRCLLALTASLVFAGSAVASVLVEDSASDEIFADAFDPPPVADFTYGAKGLAVTFTDQSVDEVGTIGAWTWDFGDGGTSSLQNPVHTFSAAGTYLVTETVVDGANKESGLASKQVTVVACGVLKSYLHDFKANGEDGGHPDFENYNAGLATGLTYPTITPGGVPTLQSTKGSLTTTQVTSAASFAQWFTDDPINFPIQQTLTLTDNSGTFAYANSAYFPIDDEGFLNYPAFMNGLHNFHFTTMLHAQIPYNGGETFSVTSADDAWVFINGHLAIDLGGVHGANTGSVTLDAAHAFLFEITAGQTYRLDFFQAQRHTSVSWLTLTTTMCLTDGQ